MTIKRGIPGNLPRVSQMMHDKAVTKIMKLREREARREAKKFPRSTEPAQEASPVDIAAPITTG